MAVWSVTFRYVHGFFELTAIQIPLGRNLNNTGGTVNYCTYVEILVLMLVGALLALTLTDAKHVVRADGSRVILMKHPTWKSELLGMAAVLRSD